MGKLEELEEELYSPGKEEELQKRIKKRITLPYPREQPPARWKEPGPKKKIGLPFDRRVLKFIWWGLGLVLAFGAALFIFLYLGTRGQEAEVSINARERVEAGELLELTLVFKNISRTTLKDSEFSLFLPAGSTLVAEDLTERPAPQRFIKKLGDLASGEEVIEEIKVRLWGREGEEKKAEAVLLYRPENLQARFTSRDLKTFTIERSPFAVSWEVPKTAAAGQEVEVVLRVVSSANDPAKNLSLLLDYPPGFSFGSSDPPPQEGEFAMLQSGQAPVLGSGQALWKLGDIPPRGEKKIVIRGRLEGSEGEVKTYRARLGVWDEKSRELQVYTDSTQSLDIAVTPLSIRAFLGDSRERVVSPGERLDFILRYRNNTDFILRNVTISAVLESGIFQGKEMGLRESASSRQFLDFTTLSIGQGGVFDGSKRAVVWGPGVTSQLRDLDPGEEGEVTFAITARARTPMADKGDKNYAVRLRSSIGSAGVPRELAGTELSSSDLVDFKVKSLVLFSGHSAFRASPLQNSGPLPPRVGEETTYTVLWEIRNFTNNIRDVEIAATIPPNVEWKGTVYPKDADIAFDASSGKVRWKIRNIEGGSGVIAPVILGAFRVGVLPGEADLGKSLTLVTESKLTGKDTFTGETVEETLGVFSSELRDDPTTNSFDWKVVR